MSGPAQKITFQADCPLCIPVYNAAGSIERYFDSVLAQTYEVNYQVITVNDGSINDSFLSYPTIKQ